MTKTKPCGYLVFSSRVKKGKFTNSLREAKNEMSKQIRQGHKNSGISEIHSKNQCKLLKKKNG